MTDRDALLAAILANPDDDTPRLVYADWIQENGQPLRAEFIRAQIEAVRAEPFSPEARRAADRARKLLEANRAAWTRHLNGGFVAGPGFERGFVAHLSVEPGGFVSRTKAIFATEPVQAIKLFRFAGTTGRASFDAFFELPQLGQLRRLELSSLLFVEEEFTQISDSPHLTGLRELSLRHNPVPYPWFSKVLREQFPQLTGLDLAEVGHIGRCLSENLPEASQRQLKRLDLTDVFFTSEQLWSVLTSRCLRQVEELRLGIAGVPGQPGPLFYLNLSVVIPWQHLVVLDLAGQRLGNEGVREIAAAKEATALRWLGLANNGLGRDAVHYLLEADHLRLNYLNVEGNRMTLSEINALRRRFPNAVIES